MSSVWLVEGMRKPRAKLRLFCFPYAGGGASVFRSWESLLPDDVEMFAVQLPGRENRIGETPFTDLEDLVQTVAQTLAPYLTKPFAFFGHSMGALLAFEITRFLRKHNHYLPVELFVSACRAPSCKLTLKRRGGLPIEDFIDEVRRLNGTPPEVFLDDELMEIAVRILRADFLVYESYKYRAEPPLECGICVFMGFRDKEVSLEQLVPWRRETNCEFSMQAFEGDHFFIHSLRDHLITCVVTRLREVLERSQMFTDAVDNPDNRTSPSTFSGT